MAENLAKIPNLDEEGSMGVPPGSVPVLARPAWFLQADWDRCTDTERQEILANKQAYLEGKAVGGFSDDNTHS